MDNSEKTEWKRLVGSYNRLVRGFRSNWGLLRSMALVHPEGGAEMETAKQRVKELQKRIGRVEPALREKKIEGVDKRIDALEIELRVFREILDLIDSHIQPADIRCFCEKTHDAKDLEICELLKFYLSKKNLSDGDADKIDFLATELCSTRVAQKRVLKNVFDVDETLSGLFETSPAPSEYEKPIIEEFRHAVKRIHGLEDVDAVLGTDVIKTMRDFKKEIRDQLANPRILKALAVYNIVLNNKLIEIFEKETGGISSSVGWVDRVKADAHRLPPAEKESVGAILDKITEIRNGFDKEKEESAYNLNLIIAAARHRKAITESMEKIKEIREMTRPPSQVKEPAPTFQKKTTRTLINELFRALLTLDETGGKSGYLEYLNLDLAKMDTWEKSVFLVDLDAMGEEKRLYEVTQEAIVLIRQLPVEYQTARDYLTREEMVGLIGENIELAENVKEEIQSFLDKYDRHSTSAIKIIDLMKVKSALARNIKRLISLSRMEGFI